MSRKVLAGVNFKYGPSGSVRWARHSLDTGGGNGIRTTTRGCLPAARLQQTPEEGLPGHTMILKVTHDGPAARGASPAAPPRRWPVAASTR